MKAEIKDFLDGKRHKNCSEHTLKAYSRILNQFEKYMRNKPVKLIAKNDILKFMNHTFPEERKKLAMRNYTLKVLHRFFFENDRNDICLYILNIKPRYQHKQIEPYSKGDIRAVIEGAKNIRDMALIALLASSGLRISEALALKRKDFDFDKMSGKVLGKGRKAGDKPEMFVYSIDAKKYLLEYIEHEKIGQNTLLFNTKGKSHKQIMQMYWQLRYYFKTRYDIHQFHRLRHFFGSVGIKQYKPRTLQKLLRHKQFGSTEIYISDSDEELLVEYQAKPIQL